MTWVKLLLLFCVYCQGLSGDPIAQNRAKRDVSSELKPRADNRCGSELKDKDKCELVGWCPGGRGRCCRNECICNVLLSPCETSAMSGPVPGHEGECALECMKKCYKTCRSENKTNDECTAHCASVCYSQCTVR
ncbi:uncharacterized protein LOC142587593 [Dermacentor variabilis]|uniref:uncharacterized protein LOC142587593 n=1 Tax=Dermacentor variabilis TaxID=34621 RepID=UPI003F5AF29D